MTSYCLQLKMVKYWINDISGNIEAMFLKLGTIKVHHKRNKMTPLSHCYGNSLATGANLTQEKNKEVICRLRVGPYSEKLWPRAWKCYPRPQAEGSIFKTSVTVSFHYNHIFNHSFIESFLS